MGQNVIKCLLFPLNASQLSMRGAPPRTAGALFYFFRPYPSDILSTPLVVMSQLHSHALSKSPNRAWFAKNPSRADVETWWVVSTQACENWPMKCCSVGQCEKNNEGITSLGPDYQTVLAGAVIQSNYILSSTGLEMFEVLSLHLSISTLYFDFCRISEGILVLLAPLH